MFAPSRVVVERASRRIAQVPKVTVWMEFTPLAIEHKAVNLGQGFPNFAPPQFVTDNLMSIVQSPSDPLNHQYARNFGRLELASALSQRYGSFLSGKALQPNEILITNGVTQGLYLSCQSLIDPGDEAIVVQPYYDSFPNIIEMAGGVVKFVSLEPKGPTAQEWVLDGGSLRDAVSEKTKLIIVNTPQNVPGKVWSAEELKCIADIAIAHDLIVVADEVYDSLAFDGAQHVSIASLPGMWERTVTLCGSSKLFSVTGWKVAWAVGPSPLIGPISQTFSQDSFCVATPLQLAVAKSLEAMRVNGYAEKLISQYTERRNFMCSMLNDVGLTPVLPKGSFFVLADTSRVDERHFMPTPTAGDTRGVVAKDWHFCRWMTKQLGVTAIPITAFCSAEARGMYDKYARFAFCKTDDAMQEAWTRLKGLKKFMK